MKENLELVEKLVEKTGISYTEAKAALEKADWDILEALINLEAEGKTIGAKAYSTRSESEPKKESESEKAEWQEKKEKRSKQNEEFKKNTISVFEWLGRVFDKGNTNNLELYKSGERKIGMPVTVFIILLIVGFWVVIPLMLVSLFFGCRYRFSGPDLGKDKINNAMGKATDYADNIKQEWKSKDSEN